MLPYNAIKKGANAVAPHITKVVPFRIKAGGILHDPIQDRHYHVDPEDPHHIWPAPEFHGGGGLPMGCLADEHMCGPAWNGILDNVLTWAIGPDRVGALAHASADQVLSPAEQTRVRAALSQCILWPSQYLKQPGAPPISDHQMTLIEMSRLGRTLSRLLPAREFTKVLRGEDPVVTRNQARFMQILPTPSMACPALRSGLLRIGAAT